MKFTPAELDSGAISVGSGQGDAQQTISYFQLSPCSIFVLNSIASHLSILPLFFLHYRIIQIALKALFLSDILLLFWTGDCSAEKGGEKELEGG